MGLMVPGEWNAAGAGVGNDFGQGPEPGRQRPGAQAPGGVEGISETVKSPALQDPRNGGVGIVRQAERSKEAEPKGGGPGGLRDPGRAAHVRTDPEIHGVYSDW